MTTPAQPALDKGKHVRYWLRCIKTCLPPDYTPTDLNRMTLGCFCIAALDVLGELPQATTHEQRKHWADWIYRNQLSTGGFRGSPATDFGKLTTRTNSVWDPANLPASFFALSALVNLGDDLSRVKRTELLKLLPRLQRSNGSFGEWLLRGREDGDADKIVGGADMRFVYMACALRWMLRGRDGEGCEDVQDFDVDKTVQYVLSARNYDGAFSEKEFGESHAGMTFCAVAALTLLKRLKDSGLQTSDAFIKWLVMRQTPFVGRHGIDEDDLEEWAESATEEEMQRLDTAEIGADGKPIWAGFHGRCNKLSDTCYSFWVGASLDMLKKIHLIDTNSNRRFLLEKTTSVVGGFTKLPLPGFHPDILHSYLGLAALALVGEEGVYRLDAALCMSMQAKERLMALDWWIEGRSMRGRDMVA